MIVGRRKEPILGYVPKNDEKKKNLAHKGLNSLRIKLIVLLYCIIKIRILCIYLTIIDFSKY